MLSYGYAKQANKQEVGFVMIFIPISFEIYSTIRKSSNSCIKKRKQRVFACLGLTRFRYTKKNSVKKLLINCILTLMFHMSTSPCRYMLLRMIYISRYKYTSRVYCYYSSLFVASIWTLSLTEYCFKKSFNT